MLSINYAQMNIIQLTFGKELRLFLLLLYFLDQSLLFALPRSDEFLVFLDVPLQTSFWFFIVKTLKLLDSVDHTIKSLLKISHVKILLFPDW